VSLHFCPPFFITQRAVLINMGGVSGVYRVESEAEFKTKLTLKVFCDVRLVLFYQIADMGKADWERVRQLLNDSPFDTLRPHLGRSRRLIKRSVMRPILPALHGKLILLYSDAPDIDWGKAKSLCKALDEEPCMQILCARWGTRILSVEMFEEMLSVPGLVGVQRDLCSFVGSIPSLYLTPLSNHGANRFVRLLDQQTSETLTEVWSSGLRHRF
jgi:hypothetical protein